MRRFVFSIILCIIFTSCSENDDTLQPCTQKEFDLANCKTAANQYCTKPLFDQKKCVIGKVQSSITLNEIATYSSKPQQIGMYFSVSETKKENGTIEPVKDLTKENIELYENGLLKTRDPETKSFFRKQVPANIMLALDYSTSMEPALEATREAALAIIESISSDQKIAVMKFSETADVIQNFSNDPQALAQAIVSPYKADAAYDLQTKFFLALNTALDNMPQEKYRANSIIIITDGPDTLSGEEIKKEVFEKIQKQKIPIYPIVIGEFDFSELKKVAENSSGHLILAKDQDYIKAKFQEAKSFVDSLYSLTYYTPVTGNVQLELKVNYKEQIAAFKKTLQVSEASETEKQTIMFHDDTFSGLPQKTAVLRVHSLYIPKNVTKISFTLEWEGDFYFDQFTTPQSEEDVGHQFEVVTIHHQLGFLAFELKVTDNPTQYGDFGDMIHIQFLLGKNIADQIFTLTPIEAFTKGDTSGSRFFEKKTYQYQFITQNQGKAQGLNSTPCENICNIMTACEFYEAENEQNCVHVACYPDKISLEAIVNSCDKTACEEFAGCFSKTLFD